MPALRKSSADLLPKSHAHLITVGTRPAAVATDVVEALVEDLKGSRPRKVIILATEDSRENAARLLKELGIRGGKGRIRILASAQSIDEAYRAANEEINALIGEGIATSEMILHYTGGTKVMSAGAVLAALNYGIQSLRYLYSKGRRSASVPVITTTAGILVDKEIRTALTLMHELRFRSARDVVAAIDREQLGAEDRERCELLSELALAYSDWDNFRIQSFLERYLPLHDRMAKVPLLADFRLSERQLKMQKRLVEELQGADIYPEELLLDLMNNAYRRLGERHPDDAMIRLHRAAELFAQGVLFQEFRIDTADVEIRKVPPRNRTAFEAERRLEDAKIKLGLRRSYELLEILGNDVGRAYRERGGFHKALHERRHLVLAHGTRAATTELALGFLQEVEALMKVRMKDLTRRLGELQFPWISNREILGRLQQAPGGSETVVSGNKKAGRGATRRRTRKS